MSPWSEEALASKKIYPPYCMRVTSKGWNERLRVTKDSMTLMVQHVHASHLMQPKALRKKVDKVRLEEMAMEAALAAALAKEVQQLLPLTDEVLQERWLGLYAGGDTKVMTELQLALAEKNCGFVPRDLPTLNELMEAHVGGGPGAAPAVLSIEQAQIDKASYDLTLRQMQYDLQAFKVWKGKMHNFRSTVDHIKLQWRLKAYESNKIAVEHFWSSYVHLCTFEDTAQPMRDHVMFKADIERKMQLPATAVVDQPKIGLMHSICIGTHTCHLFSPDVQMSPLNIRQSLGQKWRRWSPSSTGLPPPPRLHPSSSSRLAWQPP